MKVLIVEDDKALQVYLKDTMEAEGYPSQVADNGQVGLKLFNQFKPDLVLSDIQMPVMNGLEMIEAIRHQHQDTIIIIMTAFGSEEYAIQALQLGANDYLNKPVRHSDFLPLLQKYNAVIKNRTTAQEILGMIIRREFTMQFDNQIEMVPKIVNRLVLETGNVFDLKTSMGIQLGLLEILLNAMEHGNLEISYEEKTDAMETNTLHDLYAERLSNSDLAKRKVTVDFNYNSTVCEWVISDEGKGFDWQSIPNPIEEANVLSSHGRGVFLTRFQFDELEYIGKGNTVRLKKIISE